MRHPSLILALAALAACDGRAASSDPAEPLGHLAPGALAYAMGYGVDTHGVQIPDGETWSAAGMSGLTCQFNIDEGGTGTDLNVYDGDDQVIDGIGGTVLVQSDDSVRIVAFPDGDFGDAWTVPTGGTSRLLVAGGHADLGYRHASCVLAVHGSVEVAWTVPDAYCNDGGGFVVGADDTLWLGADETIARVTADGYAELPLSGSMLAADRASGLVLAGIDGDSLLSALRPDGSLAWQSDLGAPIAGFAIHGRLAVASLAGVTPDDSAVAVLDANTGAETARQASPDVPAGAVAMSDRFVAIASARRFDYLRIR